MPEQPPPPSEPLIDVDQLVDDLRERVERERAAGRYSEDLMSIGIEPVADEPARTIQDGSAPGSTPATAAQVVYRPELGYSSRPVIGPVLTTIKRLLYRVFAYPLDDLARQSNDAVRLLNGAVEQLYASSRRADEAIATEGAVRQAADDTLVGRIDTLFNQLELVDRVEAEAREHLASRVTDLEATLDRLQLTSRLARLERLSRGAAQRVPLSPTQPSEHQAPAFDYMTFENRFRPEGTVRERHSDYVELMRTRKRVVDLGCGRGELLELLREAGVSAYGVELDPDVVAVGLEKGLEILREDAVGHVEALEEGAVDGITASHLIEHLSPDVLSRLVTVAATKLPEDGILILETPNPESLLAGSINFHRDPTHVRPVHPDTLAFLCESAGFRDVEVRRLAPVPSEVRLPASEPDESPLSRHVGEVVAQLNEVIYGFQDYALIARV